jgi:putative transposase
VYNLALELKVLSYKTYGKALTAIDLCYQLVDLKKECKWLGEVDSQALQASVKKVDRSFKNFYRGFGFPKFKSKRGNQSYQIPNNKRRVDWENNKLTVPKIKNIDIVLTRRFEGAIKTVTISRTTTGKYYASILVEDGVKIPEVKAKLNKSNTIGIDMGITHFATLSNGVKIENPKYLKQSIDRLKVLQRRASKRKKGSSNRKRINKSIALLHERVTNQRNNYLHGVSSRLINDNQVESICLETLVISNMIKNHKIAQAISDVSWGEFIRQMEYKAKRMGKRVIRINQRYASSKTCSNCGSKVEELPLSVREWHCKECNSTHDRDINAAKNIKFMGLTEYKTGRRNPEEPVEMFAMAKSTKQEILYY